MRSILLATLVGLLTHAAPLPPGSPGDAKSRTGDEILVCGQLFHTGTAVVLFNDPGGYDGSKYTGGVVTYQPKGAAARPINLRGPNVTLPELKQSVDQFVLHYDVEGISKECFAVLSRRHLSVHFMLDLDGTIYQCLDLKEDAYHATIANSRSIGVEIANVGGWEGNVLPANVRAWYVHQGGETRIGVPARFGTLHNTNVVLKPAKPSPVSGQVQSKFLHQYDFTNEQYQALSHLSATLCTVFPKIQPDYPRQATRPAGKDAYPFAEPEKAGTLINHVLPAHQYAAFQGILGHFHVQLDKIDPGPALQWDNLMKATRDLMTPAAKAENVKGRHQPVVTKWSW